jgi:2,3-bisphosphoglycerate-independent phosphoglycerate mutase
VVDVLVIPDGAAAATLDAAHTPTLDGLTAEGATALVQTTPAGLAPGSETCIPALLGRPPRAQPGRGRVDAAAYGIEVPPGLIPWRVDVVGAGGTRATADQAAATAHRLGAIHTRGHRLLLLAPQKPAARSGLIIWDDGPAPSGPLDAPTAIVCADGAAAGCGRLLGAHVIVPAGATGDVDTDLGAKARAAITALDKCWRRVVVHVGAPDEAAHRRDRPTVIQVLERIDRQLLAPLAEAVRASGGRLAVCPDHATDPLTGRHDSAPVRAVRWGAGIEPETETEPEREPESEPETETEPEAETEPEIETETAAVVSPEWLHQPQAVAA